MSDICENVFIKNLMSLIEMDETHLLTNEKWKHSHTWEITEKYAFELWSH